MKKQTIFAVFVVILVFLGFTVAAKRPLTKPVVEASALTNSNAEGLVFQTLDRKKIVVSDLKGKVVVLNFWATWCPPCVEEIPGLVSLEKAYRSKGLVVIGISMDENADTVRQFVKEYHVTYPISMASTELLRQVGDIQSIPTTIVIDRNGRASRPILGYHSYENFEAIVKQYLTEKGKS